MTVISIRPWNNPQSQYKRGLPEGTVVYRIGSSTTCERFTEETIASVSKILTNAGIEYKSLFTGTNYWLIAISKKLKRKQLGNLNECFSTGNIPIVTT